MHTDNPTSDVATSVIPKEKEKLAKLEAKGESSVFLFIMLHRLAGSLKAILKVPFPCISSIKPNVTSIA
ncbi:hypothetical protein SUGI_1135670 [Cryptomeria japonica]|nr:hypothetical protein SUGI_1135670 [Cryptomeria japonica]